MTWARIVGAGVVALAALTTGAAAQNLGESVSGLARATVIQPISLSEVKALDFGTVTPGAKPGTVTVGADAAIQTSDTGITTTGAHSPAIFTVAGQSGRAFSVTTTSVVKLTGGVGNSLTVSNLAPSVNGGGSAGQLDTDGAAEVRVGGTLAIPPATPPGRYVGNYPVSIAYQ